MIWLKRLSPFLLLGLFLLGYQAWGNWRTKTESVDRQQHALIFAQVWVASARFHDNPTKFISYRDSLLTTHSMTPTQMNEYQLRYDDNPEQAQAFAEDVKLLVDSLLKLEKADTAQAVDSTHATDNTQTVDTTKR